MVLKHSSPKRGNQGSNPCSPATYVDDIVPFLVKTKGEVISVCDRDFPKFCGNCEHRFICYTNANKFMALLEFQIYNEIRK